MKIKSIVFIVTLVFLSSCAVDTTSKDLALLINQVQTLEEKINQQEKAISCLNSPITKGVYYATTAASWTIYSLEFYTCSVLRITSYDEYGDLIDIHYFTVEEFEPMKFKITGELSFYDSMGISFSYDQLVVIWGGKDDFLRELKISSDYRNLDFGSVNDIHQSRSYAVLNVVDKNFWSTRKK